MASAKSSRSRPAGHSGVFPVGSAAAVSSGGGGDGGVQLADKLKIFKTDNFDPDSYVQSKCQTMNEKEIRHLCSYLQDLKKASAEEMRRSVYANYAAFIRTSKEISDLEGELLSIRNLLNTQAALIHGLSEGVQIDSLTSGPEGSVEDDISNVEDQEPSEIQKWAADFPDMLDVLLAERRVDEALALDALDEAERRLADQLAEAACQSSTRGIELRAAAASALKRLGDGPLVMSFACSPCKKACFVLLCSCWRLESSCRMCSNITWAIVSLLEARGLSVSSVLLKQFKPSLEQALDANLRRIEESTAALAAADDWILTYPPSGIRPLTRSSAANLALQPKLSNSAHRFNSMVQDFFEDVAPLLTLQLGGSTMDGITQIFNSYVNLLISALPGSMDDEANLDGLGHKIVRMAETEEQQLALLANASLLAEELLPRAAMKLSSINQSNMDDLRKRGTDKQNRMPEQREWKRKLQRMELYAKLNRMAGIAAEMFVGRERFATLLMMRLTETVILWLSEDQAFWEEIEQGPKPLGPIGLQQFYLDMQFVIIFGQGRFLSRHVHQVILDIIDRAMAAFSATGINPDSVLPGDDWFMDVAHDVVSMISGKGRAANGDREINSPTASVSAHSISSFRSHGSS
ncbi:hypothetical protein PR202_ga28004 [Eleusine coracana subsp. coracana]|uniref:Exocyst component Exo84 C-terminal domain-containing protein n=1 Tax=Eleusine coracana subsp. coracana TaxID=191504 RepID=A0AAV5DHG7_ELECO|nr:hypothetical protein PR202_ga28004 [Eleusine coracana subsp. coracana]